MGSITPERRDRSLFQAKLLAGALWEASAVMVDELFEDLSGLLKLDRVDRQDIANPESTKAGAVPSFGSCRSPVRWLCQG
jgi:hypothetical protein